MGTKQATPADFLPARPVEEEPTPVELPISFDWRTDPRAAKCHTPTFPARPRLHRRVRTLLLPPRRRRCPSLAEVRDQSNCGSCWAFGSVEAMTDRICLASKGAKNVHLSAQDVASCDHLVSDTRPPHRIAAAPMVTQLAAARAGRHGLQRRHPLDGLHLLPLLRHRLWRQLWRQLDVLLVPDAALRAPHQLELELLDAERSHMRADSPETASAD